MCSWWSLALDLNIFIEARRVESFMEEDTKVSSATQGPVIQLPGDLCERSFGRVLGVDAVVCSY